MPCDFGSIWSGLTDMSNINTGMAMVFSSSFWMSLLVVLLIVLIFASMYPSKPQCNGWCIFKIIVNTFLVVFAAMFIHSGTVQAQDKEKVKKQDKKDLMHAIVKGGMSRKDEDDKDEDDKDSSDRHADKKEKRKKEEMVDDDD